MRSRVFAAAMIFAALIARSDPILVETAVGVHCTLSPKEVMDRVQWVSGMTCSTFDRVPYAMRPDDKRTEWFVETRPGETADPREKDDWVGLDDVTGPEIARGAGAVLPPTGVSPHQEPVQPPKQ